MSDSPSSPRPSSAPSPWPPTAEDGVLAVFAKRPDPGAVKTRLADVVGANEAAALAEAMLLDLTELWSDPRLWPLEARKVVVFDPPDAGPWFDQRLGPDWALQPQEPGDLGRRMRGFLEAEFAEGRRRILLIGSDAPHLEPSWVVTAFMTLAHRDLVIGPAADGGYVLLGARDRVPPIFDQIDWGSQQVLNQTLDHLETTEGRTFSLGLLPVGFDVDRVEEAVALRGLLRGLRRAGADHRLLRVEAWLERMQIAANMG